jgi:hypothetical protein
MNRDSGEDHHALVIKSLMGLQRRLVEAFCCPSPLPVSTPLSQTLREVYD